MGSESIIVGQAVRLIHSEAEAVLTASANRNPEAWKLLDESQQV
jgi:hypothetical protein